MFEQLLKSVDNLKNAQCIDNNPDIGKRQAIRERNALKEASVIYRGYHEQRNTLLIALVLYGKLDNNLNEAENAIFTSSELEKALKYLTEQDPELDRQPYLNLIAAVKLREGKIR